MAGVWERVRNVFDDHLLRQAEAQKSARLAVEAVEITLRQVIFQRDRALSRLEGSAGSNNGQAQAQIKQVRGHRPENRQGQGQGQGQGV
jgi:hypothetical protein